MRRACTATHEDGRWAAAVRVGAHTCDNDGGVAGMDPSAPLFSSYLLSKREPRPASLELTFFFYSSKRCRLLLFIFQLATALPMSSVFVHLLSNDLPCSY